MALLRQLLGCLMVARSIAAFLPPPGTTLPGSHGVLGQRSQPSKGGFSRNGQKRSARAVSSPGLRVGMVDSSEALKQLQDWGGTPPNSKFVCSNSKSDAGVMAEFFSEVSKEQKGADQMILIAPNCRSAADTKAMQRLAEHLKRSCDAANVKYLDGAPQPALTFIPSPGAPEPSSDLTSAEVMNKCLDWFQTMLVSLSDEEDFVEIGRILLSVQQYSVNKAVSSQSFLAGFWKEVASLVEGGDGNTMIVAPNFMPDDPTAFEAFVHSQLEQPLAQFAAEDKQLRISFFHPKGPKKSPWPIIQIYFFDPAPPKGEDFGDVDFDAEMEWGGVSKEELLQAKALLDAQKSAAETRMPPSIPLEIDPFKPGPGSDKADGKGFGKKD